MNFYPTDHAIQRYLERAAQGMTEDEARLLVAKRAEDAYWHGSLRGSKTGKIRAQMDGLQFVLDDRRDGFAVVTVFFPKPREDDLRQKIRRLTHDAWAAQERRRRQSERRMAERHRR